MTPLIVGCPNRGGLAALMALSASVPGAVTLAWRERDDLVAAVPQVLDAGGTTLLVDAMDAASASQALAHQLQVMGAPQFVCFVADDARDAADLGRLAHLVLESVPPCAVLVVGGEAATRSVSAALDRLELPAPLSVRLDEATVLAVELVASARWETV